MKLKNALAFLILIVFSCVGEDYIDDYIAPSIRITNPILNIEEGSSFQLKAKFFDTAGDEVLQPTFNWTSTTPAIITIDNQGTIIALQSGKAVVK